MTDIVEVEGGADLEDVRVLFREYAAGTGVDLCFQDFPRELLELPGEYVAPMGVLLLARVGGAAAGCVAAHRWDEGACEMKRLFVRREFRGLKLGYALANEVIARSRAAGYHRVLLDTLPSMGEAQVLYAKLGFREIAPYRFNPIPGAKYMELVLKV
jgi:ribosomal protein S18 acetylase RimI-like enzyme